MQCDPLKPLQPLLGMRYPTSGEIEWLECGKPLRRVSALASVPLSSLTAEALLARFGLASEAALGAWREQNDVESTSYAQGASVREVAPPSAALVGNGATVRRRFRFKQPSDAEAPAWSM